MGGEKRREGITAGAPRALREAVMATRDSGVPTSICVVHKAVPLAFTGFWVPLFLSVRSRHVFVPALLPFRRLFSVRWISGSLCGLLALLPTSVAPTQKPAGAKEGEEAKRREWEREREGLEHLEEEKKELGGASEAHERGRMSSSPDKGEAIDSVEQIPSAKDADVVSVELPAPNGWFKKFIPKKGGTPRRSEIVFISPTGEEIRSKKQLDKYLKEHPGGPSSTEFDWGTGDTPRRSARISEKLKAAETPEHEPPKKRARTSSSSKKAGKKKGNEEAEGPNEEEDAVVETENGASKDVEMSDAGKSDDEAEKHAEEDATDKDDIKQWGEKPLEDGKIDLKDKEEDDTEKPVEVGEVYLKKEEGKDKPVEDDKVNLEEKEENNKEKLVADGKVDIGDREEDNKQPVEYSEKGIEQKDEDDKDESIKHSEEDLQDKKEDDKEMPVQGYNEDLKEKEADKEKLPPQPESQTDEKVEEKTANREVSKEVQPLATDLNVEQSSEKDSKGADPSFPSKDASTEATEVASLEKDEKTVESLEEVQGKHSLSNEDGQQAPTTSTTNC
ncbi:Methyl-CpG-binding domain-containing protein 11 [Nymphaea thermarum]|nr:Methyl-CpG-binding domain-containing protein 11 [Nymphaea thermarum]